MRLFTTLVFFGWLFVFPEFTISQETSDKIFIEKGGQKSRSMLRVTFPEEDVLKTNLIKEGFIAIAEKTKLCPTLANQTVDSWHIVNAVMASYYELAQLLGASTLSLEVQSKIMMFVRKDTKSLFKALVPNHPEMVREICQVYRSLRLETLEDQKAKL